MPDTPSPETESRRSRRRCSPKKAPERSRASIVPSVYINSMSPGANVNTPVSYTMLSKAPITPDWHPSSSTSPPRASPPPSGIDSGLMTMVGGWPAEQYVARPALRSILAIKAVTNVSTLEKPMSMLLRERAMRAGPAPSQAYAVRAVLTSADIDAASMPLPDTSPRIMTAQSSGRRMSV